MRRQFMSLGILVAASLVLAPSVLADDSIAEGDTVEPASFLGGTGLRIYADELEQLPFDRLLYGFDRNAVCANGAACVVDSDCSPPNEVCGLTVDSLAPGTQTTIWDLVCDPLTPWGDDCQAHSWDFSSFDLEAPGLLEGASTNAPIDLDETCSANACGFNRPNAVLGREDKEFERLIHVCEDLTTPCVQNGDCPGRCLYAGLCDDDITRCTEDNQCNGIGDGRCREGLITVTAVEREDRASDVTVWLRASVRGEGVVGSLGLGESRVCFVGTNLTEVPLLRFDEQDAGGWYMDLGDSWTHAPFDCDSNTFNTTCPDSCGGLCPIKTNACTKNCDGQSQSFSGQQQNTVFNEGVVKLPSGHRFNALVLLSVNEFCAQPSLFGCPGFLTSQPIRTALVLFQVPWFGTVVRLQTNLLECDVKATEILGEVDIKYGLLPPLSVTVDDTSSSTISLSWDPGLDRRITRYKVYWDADSGFDTTYTYNSDTHSEDVEILGTTAVIGDLDPGVEYFVTVSAFSDYTNPASGETRTYESLMPPKRIANDPPAVPSYPIEVAATTDAACAPTEEVLNVVVDKVDGTCRVSWDPNSDPCIDGYRVKGDVVPDSPQTFTDLIDTEETFVDFDPTESYFLVVGKVGDPGGPEGPLGHDRD